MSNKGHIEIYFLFFLETRILTFHANCLSMTWECCLKTYTCTNKHKLRSPWSGLICQLLLRINALRLIVTFQSMHVNHILLVYFIYCSWDTDLNVSWLSSGSILYISHICYVLICIYTNKMLFPCLVWYYLTNVEYQYWYNCRGGWRRNSGISNAAQIFNYSRSGNILYNPGVTVRDTTCGT